MDDAPWGFAPFHYGRWLWWGNRWHWAPGPKVARPVYAPALVGWMGGPQFGVAVGSRAVPAMGWLLARALPPRPALAALGAFSAGYAALWALAVLRGLDGAVLTVPYAG